jgi:uncharacterized protein
MLNNNKTILIEDIENAENKEIQVIYEDFIEDIKSKEPIYAELNFKSLGQFIEVTGTIKGYATLTCDLCLEEYEYKIDINIDELYAKQSTVDEAKQEIEIKKDGFITDLNGEKEIDIEDLLYQSVILDFPNKKVCDINCNGGDIFLREEEEEKLDPRMSIFKDIKINK